MKRRYFFLVATIILVAIQFITNCSNPLDDATARGPSQIDPGNIYGDTIVNTDTIVVVDTTSSVDTVVIVYPDSGFAQPLCSPISSSQPEIVWMFRNAAGHYLLDFMALPESDHPVQQLTIDIDGQELRWVPSAEPEKLVDINLEANTVIRIYPNKPPSLGHAVHICLVISRP